MKLHTSQYFCKHPNNYPPHDESPKHNTHPIIEVIHLVLLQHVAGGLRAVVDYDVEVSPRLKLSLPVAYGRQRNNHQEWTSARFWARLVVGFLTFVYKNQGQGKGYLCIYVIIIIKYNVIIGESCDLTLNHPQSTITTLPIYPSTHLIPYSTISCMKVMDWIVLPRPISSAKMQFCL